MLRTTIIAAAASLALAAPAFASGKTCHNCYKNSDVTTQSHVTQTHRHVVNVHVRHVKVVRTHHSYEVHHEVSHGPVKRTMKVKGHAPRGCWWKH